MRSSFLINRASGILKSYFPRQLTVIKNTTSFTQRCGLHLTPCLPKIISFHLSDIGEGIREVTVKEWFVKVGDTIEQFDDICEVQSDKASVTITSRYDGKIVKLHHNVNDIAYVGKALLDFEVDEKDDDCDSESSDSDRDSKNSSNTVKTDNIQRLIALATPAVRRIAMENSVDLSKVPGTGPNGRVLKGDLLQYLGQIPKNNNESLPDKCLQMDRKPEKTELPADRIENIRGVRKAMIKSMTESLKIPHFAYSDEVDMTKLVEFRNQMKSVAVEQGLKKLTFMPFCIKAASIALAKHPIINSSFDAVDETLTYRGAHNISVAIDTPQGLVVPNIKNCQSKSILEIAKDLDVLVEKGRSGSLTPQDFADGTFSLSNIGVVGGTYTHPCIMAPQVSIGAMGRTKVVPRFNDKDQVIKAYIMNVSWCADHRIVDGVTMANFSNVWKHYLENPALFLLH